MVNNNLGSMIVSTSPFLMWGMVINTRLILSSESTLRSPVLGVTFANFPTFL